MQYQQPPLSFDGSVIGVPEVMGLHVRVRVYDYGVVSLALTARSAARGRSCSPARANADRQRGARGRARRLLPRLVSRVVTALDRPRETFLSEDYAVFAVSALDQPLTADALVAEHGADIARLLRGENQTLSTQEIDEVLRHRLSYLADDLVVPTWNAAFVYDAAAGAAAASRSSSSRNSQLLQYRYYDQLLDAQLGRLYDQLQTHRQPYLFGARRYTRSARQVHALTIDVRELLDRTENALKFVGDIYAARLFALVGARLGLERWKGTSATSSRRSTASTTLPSSSRASRAASSSSSPSSRSSCSS